MRSGTRRIGGSGSRSSRLEKGMVVQYGYWTTPRIKTICHSTGCSALSCGDNDGLANPEDDNMALYRRELRQSVQTRQPDRNYQL